MKLLEVVMKESPADVFWLQDRWKVSLEKPQCLPGKAPKESITWATAQKKRRGLVWLEADAGPVPALQYVEPDDLELEYSFPVGAPRPVWLSADAIVHLRPVVDRRRLIAAEINRIDRISALPLDFVYVPYGPGEAIAVCRQMGMPVVITPEGDL